MNRARSAVVAGALAFAGAACNQTPVSPSPSTVPRPLLMLTERLETEHFLFYYSPGDRIEAERSEAYHRWATAYLGVWVPVKIEYYKYRQLEDMYCTDSAASSAKCLPVGAIGMASGGSRIYTSETWHPHECFHIYTARLGSPPTCFNEGMATAHIVDPFNDDFVPRSHSSPGSEPLLTAAARFYSQGRLVPIESLLAGWSQVPSGLSYPEAGSFVRFLVDTYGLERMKEVFRTIRYNDPLDVVLAKFEGIYGMSLRAAEAEWHAFLALPR